VKNWNFISRLNTIKKLIKLILKLVPHIPLGTDASTFTKIIFLLYDITLSKRASKECLVLGFSMSLGIPIDRLHVPDGL
jgi:hypothetical protein